MLPSLFVPVLGAASVHAGLLSLLQPRGVNEIWGGFNLTQAALDIRDSISSPTCANNTYCQDFVARVIPQCLRMQGDAGCWCNLHDPLHYCALCMSNPTDNTTSAEQTQLATNGHGNYHKGCGAYQLFLNASASGSLSSAAPSATASPSAAAANDGGSSFGTGALVGVIIGGVAGVVIIIAATFLIYRKMQNDKINAQHDTHVNAFHYNPTSPGGPGGGGGGHGGVHQPTYTGGGGTVEVKTPYPMGTTPPPPPFVTYSAQPMSPMGEYNPRESTFSQPSSYGPVPTTAHSDTASNPPGHSPGFGGPPPPFVANPGMHDYDHSMLAALPPPSGKFRSAAEPM